MRLSPPLFHVPVLRVHDVRHGGVEADAGDGQRTAGLDSRGLVLFSVVGVHHSSDCGGCVSQLVQYEVFPTQLRCKDEVAPLDHHDILLVYT